MKTNIVWGFVGAWIVSLAVAIVALTPNQAAASDPYACFCGGCGTCLLSSGPCPKPPNKVCDQNCCKCMAGGQGQRICLEQP